MSANNSFGLRTIMTIAGFLPAGGRTFARAFCKYVSQPGKSVYKVSHGFNMNLDLSREYDRELCFGLYEKGTTKHITRMLKSGSLFIDVGANVGYFTLIASEIVGPSGRVLSFEADPSNVAELQGNIALNKVENVEVFPFAAGDHEGNADFVTGEGSVGNSLENEAGTIRELGPEYIGRHKKVITVPMTTLDCRCLEWVKKCPGTKVLKIDVEGAEPLVLRGGKQLLSYMDAVVVESNPVMLRAHGFGPDTIIRELTDAGFQGYLVKERFGTLRKIRPDLHCAGNLLFIKPEKRK